MSRQQVGFSSSKNGRYGSGSFVGEEETNVPLEGSPRPDYADDSSVQIQMMERPYVSSGSDTDEDGSTDAVDSIVTEANLPSRRISELRHHTLQSGLKRRKSSAAALKRRQSRVRRPTHIYNTWRQNPKQMEQEIMKNLEEDDIIDGGDDEFKKVRHAEELRGMTISLSQKKAIKERLEKTTLGKRESKRISSWRHLKYGCSIRLQHAKLAIYSYIRALGFWESHMKTIASHFGTDVTAYFLFLRWLFLANFTGLLLLLFIYLPQLLLVWAYSSDKSSEYFFVKPTYAAEGTEFLTGTSKNNGSSGFFDGTGMYYGHYSNGTLFNVDMYGQPFYYNIPWAYLFTYCAYFLIFFVAIAISAARSYRKNFIESSGKFTFQYVLKILDGWDFSIDAEEAAKRKTKNIYYDLKEFCAGRKNRNRVIGCCDTMQLWAFRFVAYIIQLLIIVGCAAAVAFAYSYLEQERFNIGEVIRDLVIPTIVSAINTFIPFLFTFIAIYLKFRNPQSVVYSALFMTFLLYISTLLVFFGLTLIPCGNADLKNITAAANFPNSSVSCPQCWETRLGEKVFSLVIVDFILFVVVTFFSEVLYRLCTSFCCKSISHPQFDIARNTMNLIYNQFLLWFGVYYCPLLTVVVGLKFFLTFYMKRVTVMRSCIPTKKPWRAAKMHTIFLGFLFLGFILCAILFAVVITSIIPSRGCGPFAGQPAVIDVVTEKLQTVRDQQVLKILFSPGVVVGIIVVLCVAVHYVRVVSAGKKELITLLQLQITMESRDKVYLRNMLDRVQRHKNNKAYMGPTQCDCPGPCGEYCSHAQLKQPDDTPILRPAAGRLRVFAKQKSEASFLSESQSSLAGSREDLTKHPDNIRSAGSTIGTDSRISTAQSRGKIPLPKNRRGTNLTDSSPYSSNHSSTGSDNKAYH